MQPVRTRVVICALLLLCALQTLAICKQAQWLGQQRQLIRQLWDARRARYHRPVSDPVWKI